MCRGKLAGMDPVPFSPHEPVIPDGPDYEAMRRYSAHIPGTENTEFRASNMPLDGTLNVTEEPEGE